MLTELRVKNVRVFSGGTWAFQLRSLTVFCGTNSAGKSTLLKIVPLLRQTQATRDSHKSPVARLRFVGSQVDFGTFNCFASADRDTPEVEVGVTIKSPVDESFLSVFPAVQNDIRRGDNVDDDLPQADVHYDLKADFCFDTSSSPDTTPSPSDDADSYSTERDPHSLRAARYSLQVGGRKVLNWQVHRAPPEATGKATGRPERTQYLLNIPSSYFKDVGGPRLMTPLAGDSQTTTLPVMLRGLLPQSIITKWAHTADNPPDNEEDDESEKEEWGVFPIPPHIEEATRDLSFTLTNARYVGPLRAPARRYYLTRFDGGNESDPTGEFLPYILRDLASLNPVVNRRGLGASHNEAESLNDALNYWLHFLRTGNRASKHDALNEVEAIQTKSVLVEIKLMGPRSTQAHSIADSGFGYSQVLPILVSVLLSSPDDTTLIEQPELHLNPALQVRIAEFFAAMAQTGRQVILETHSEHIVNALRVFVAEDTSTKLAPLCNIYYIDAEMGPPRVRSLEIEPNGNVPDWPASFFGEAVSLAGRLLRAQKRFRQNLPGGR